MASCVCSPLKPPQHHFQRNYRCLPIIHLQNSNRNFYCKPPFRIVCIPMTSNKNRVLFQSRFQLRKSSHQDKESRVFPQDTEEISYSNDSDAKSSNLGSSSSSSSTSLLSFLCPLLKLFSVSLLLIPFIDSS